MSRPASILSVVVIVAFFGAAATAAQTTLQGRSQYGGLIRNVNSGRCIDVFGGSTNKNANVQQFSCNNGANQRWEFVDVGNGQYAIRNVNSGQVLTLPETAGAMEPTCSSSHGTAARTRGGGLVGRTTISS